MENLETRFKIVAKALENKHIPLSLSNTQLLHFYALYKQSTVGDCDVPAPSRINVTARKKWDAHSAVKGKRKEDAMQEYVDGILSALREIDLSTVSTEAQAAVDTLYADLDSAAGSAPASPASPLPPSPSPASGGAASSPVLNGSTSTSDATGDVSSSAASLPSSSSPSSSAASPNGALLSSPVSTSSKGSLTPPVSDAESDDSTASAHHDNPDDSTASSPELLTLQEENQRKLLALEKQLMSLVALTLGEQTDSTLTWPGAASSPPPQEMKELLAALEDKARQREEEFRSADTKWSSQLSQLESFQQHLLTRVNELQEQKRLLEGSPKTPLMASFAFAPSPSGSQSLSFAHTPDDADISSAHEFPSPGIASPITTASPSPSPAPPVTKVARVAADAASAAAKLPPSAPADETVHEPVRALQFDDAVEDPNRKATTPGAPSSSSFLRAAGTAVAVGVPVAIAAYFIYKRVKQKLRM